MFEVETVVVKEALSWMKEQRWHKVIIGTDPLLKAQSINEKGVDLLEVGHVIESCRIDLDSLHDTSVSFVRKHTNKVDHELVRIPCSVNCFNVLMSPPMLLLETIMYDISS